MIIENQTPQRQAPFEPQTSRDRHHAHQALDIAFCLYSNGHLATLAWCAAGKPDRGIAPRDMEFLQAARSVIQSNGGRWRPGDEQRVLLAVRPRKGRA
jgi:hypothetical protein